MSHRNERKRDVPRMPAASCRAAAVIAVAGALLIPASRSAFAHEGHAALPSTGATVDGDQLLLSPSAIQAVGMETVRIGLRDVREELRVNAQLELPWNQQAKVATLLSGRVAEVFVKPGEAVRAGQELARIESLDLESIQSELLESATRVDLLRRLVEQRAGLAERGGISGKMLLETQAELREVTARLRIARLKLQGYGIDGGTIDEVLRSGQPVGSVVVASPIAGIVRHGDVRPGQLVEASEHLFDIVDSSRLYAVGDVPETDAHLLSVGQPVLLSLAGLPEREWNGRVERIAPKLSAAQRTLGVVASVENPDALLRAGMFGRMTIRVFAADDQIVCPQTALVETGEGTFVLRRDGEGKYRRQPVRVARRSNGTAVIESGLFPGQEVIVRGTHLLAAMFDRPTSNAGTKTASTDGDRRVAESMQSSENTAFDRAIAPRAVVELPTAQAATITSLIEGRVAEIFVEPGGEVAAGEVVAQLASPQLRTMQLELLETQAKFDWSRNQVERLRPLAEKGMAATRELWEREAEAQILARRVESLSRKLGLVGLTEGQVKLIRNLDLSTVSAAAEEKASIVDVVPIRTPIGGRITEFDVVPGQLVHSHDRLFEVQDLRTVWVQAWFFERDAVRIRPGQAAIVTFPADPGLRVEGRVLRSGPMLDSAERVLPVWIEIPNPHEFLKEGMLANVAVRIPRGASGLLVSGPQEAGDGK
ncbi:MAG: efflux RND transporter periplasmic adaptor subunit [Planctomycetaceae bacterium]